MNYATLIGAKSVEGSIRNWINHASVPATAILVEAETEIYRRLRTREMRANVAVALAQGASSAALPVRYLDPIALHHRSGESLTYKTQRDINGLRVWDEVTSNFTRGWPGMFSVFDELLQFDCVADRAYPLVMSYWRQPAPLAGDNQTNFLTDRYPRLLRVACLRAAAEFMESMDKFNSYDAQMTRMLAEIDIMDDMSLVGIDPSTEWRDHG